MMMRRALAAGMIALATATPGARAQSPELHTAHGHPIQYYLSLPADWTPGREWPVLIAVEGSGRRFELEHQIFVQARGKRPYILVTPLVLSDKGRYRPPYPYPLQYWQNGTGDFDMGGLRHIIDDVHREYGGRERVYLTGFSGGGHVAWMMAFTHPELLAGVAAVASNFNGRGVGTISTAPERVSLPIRGFQGDNDPYRQMLDPQWTHAEAVARAHGYENLSHVVVPGANHDRMAARVFAWVDSLEVVRSRGGAAR